MLAVGIAVKTLMLGASLFLVLMMAAPAVMAQAKCEPGKVAQKYPSLAGKTITIATTPFYAPYEYADPANPDRIVGSDIEISEQALACAGVKSSYLKGVYTSLMSSVTGGKADAMVANLYYTPERGRALNFVLFMRAGGAVVVPKGNPRRIRSMDDLCGLTANAVVGTVSTMLIQQQQASCKAQKRRDLQVVLTPEADAAFRGLRNNRIDFMLDNLGSVRPRVMAPASGLEIAFTVPEPGIIGFGVTKGNDALLRAYRDGIEVMQRDGRMARILQKYGLDARLIYSVEIKK